jgi:glycosyltransferase involved in cell wall biosynthesis
LIVTPAKNEEDMLPDVARDIINQSVKPILWLIIDDGSTDRTWEIVQNLKKEFQWIEGIRLKFRKRSTYGWERLRHIVRKGFSYAIDFCDKHHLDYKFLAIVESDVRLERGYFEKLIRSFYEDKKLGLASGFILEEKMRLERLARRERHPTAAAMLLRRECYEAVGGWQGHSPVMIKARNRGWRIKGLRCAKLLHRRKTSSRKSYLSQGEYHHFLNFHPISAARTGISLMSRAPAKGLLYLVGFSRSLLLKEEKLKDEEIRRYYWNSANLVLRQIAKKLRLRR